MSCSTTYLSLSNVMIGHSERTISNSKPNDEQRRYSGAGDAGRHHHIHAELCGNDFFRTAGAGAAHRHWIRIGQRRHHGDCVCRGQRHAFRDRRPGLQAGRSSRHTRHRDRGQPRASRACSGCSRHRVVRADRWNPDHRHDALPVRCVAGGALDPVRSLSGGRGIHGRVGMVAGSGRYPHLDRLAPLARFAAAACARTALNSTHGRPGVCDWHAFHQACEASLGVSRAAAGRNDGHAHGFACRRILVGGARARPGGSWIFHQEPPCRVLGYSSPCPRWTWLHCCGRAADTPHLLLSPP